MSETEEKTKVERIGLNSLRDFYLDEWQGKVVTGVDEANKYVSFIVKNMNEKSILKKLRNGDFFIAFVKDFKNGEVIVTDYDSLKEISFRIIPVEMGLGLIYFRLNRKKGRIPSHFITAELEGMTKLLKDNNFNPDYTRQWMACRIPDRIVCIKEINLILQNPRLVEAFKCYNQYFDREDYENWRSEFGVDLKIRRGHRHLISSVIKSLTGDGCKKSGK